MGTSDKHNTAGFMQDLSGTTIGQYELRSILGKGGMATIYRAYQPSMEREVAIKLLSPDLSDETEFIARFEREARIIAGLQHPNILPVFDFGREGRYVYLVMRLVEGGTLGDELRGKPLPAERVIRLTNQIAAALDYAHRQGIVHRDLKPTNILLNDQDVPLLTDFGIAKLLAGSTITGLTAPNAVMGTPTYMAPEQWRSEPVDARTDVYALGIIVYQMLLGKVPFASETPHGLMYQHLDKMPTPARTINPALPFAIEPVIRKALAKAPHDRFASAGDLARALETALRFPSRIPEQTLFETPDTTPRSHAPESDEVEERPSRGAGHEPEPRLTTTRPRSEPPPHDRTRPPAPRDTLPREPIAAPAPVRRPRRDAPRPGHHRPPVPPQRRPSSPVVTGYTPPYRPPDHPETVYGDDGGGLGRMLIIAASVAAILIVAIGVTLVSALLLQSDEENPRADTRQPVLTITAPADGTAVALGSLVNIQFTCSGERGITRIELRRFDQVLNTIDAHGETLFNGWFTYVANTTGTHEITLVAYSGDERSDPVTLILVVQ